MSIEQRDKSTHGYQRFRSVLHIGMGFFYLIIGVLIIYVKYFGAMALPDTFAYVLGGMMILYGLFRLWRGFADMRALTRRDIRREFPSLHDMDETV